MKGCECGEMVIYDEDDLKVTFMQLHGPASTFSWPSRQDICWVPTAHVLAAVDIRTATGRYDIRSREEEC